MLGSILTSVTCVAALAAPVPGQRREFAVGDRGFAVVRAVDSAERDGFTGVVLAADRGQILAVVATGSGTDATRPDTLFEIASLTKQFTAAAVLRLAQDGLLSLDDPIAKHLPGVPPDSQAITLRHLLGHTSGIPGSNSRGGGQDIRAALPEFLQGGPRHPPGTRWEYWNQGYAILSEVVARASGKPFAQYVRDELFRPAGMSHSGFTGDTPPADPPVAVGRSGSGPQRSAFEHPYGSDGLQYRGMGGAVTNVWDLWLWDRALHRDAVLSDALKAELFAPGLGDYALGWFVLQGPHGAVHHHSGLVRGFAASLRRYPDRDGLIVVLGSTDQYRTDSLALAIERAIFDDAPPALNGPGLEQLLARLVGQYSGPRDTKLIIQADLATPGRAPARITWAGRFPDTAGSVILRDGSLVFDDGDSRSALTPTIIDGVVTKILMEFPGADPWEYTPDRP